MIINPEGKEIEETEDIPSSLDDREMRKAWVAEHGGGVG